MDDTMFIDFPLIFHCWSLEEPRQHRALRRRNIHFLMLWQHFIYHEQKLKIINQSSQEVIYLINCHHCELDVMSSIDYVTKNISIFTRSMMKMSHEISHEILIFLTQLTSRFFFSFSLLHQSENKKLVKCFE